MSALTAAFVPSLLGLLASKTIFGGGSIFGGSKAQAAPAPAAAPLGPPAKTDADVATRAAQIKQRAAGGAVETTGGLGSAEDGSLTKERAAKRTLLG